MIKINNDILMSNGEIFRGHEIDELIVYIINEFAKKGLSAEKSKIVLDATKDLVCEYSIVKPINL